MDTKDKVTTENIATARSGEEEISNNSNLQFSVGTILHGVRADKYTSDVKEIFTIEDKESRVKFRIKKITMIEMAKEAKKNKEFSILINNGWEASGKMSSGAGNAVKIESVKDWYNCSFFIGKMGKPFDVKDIQDKRYIKLSKEHLEAIFTFLICDEEVALAKAEESRIQRTTLAL